GPIRTGGFCVSNRAEQRRLVADGECRPCGPWRMWRIKKESAGAIRPLAEPNKDEREKFSFFSYGAVFVEVHVDFFGQVRVKRATGVYDAGRMINPKLARSQIMGGLIFAISTALFEGTVPDQATGRAVNANLAEYHVAVHADTPPA